MSLYGLYLPAGILCQSFSFKSGGQRLKRFWEQLARSPTKRRAGGLQRPDLIGEHEDQQERQTSQLQDRRLKTKTYLYGERSVLDHEPFAFKVVTSGL